MTGVITGLGLAVVAAPFVFYLLILIFQLFLGGGK